MSVEAAVARLQVHAKAQSGVLDAPALAPESVNMFPFAVSYPMNGRLLGMAGWTKGLHVLAVEFHCSLTLLPQAIQQAMGYLDAYPVTILADPTLNGAVQTIVADQDTPLRYEFGRLRWGNIATIGVRFLVTVKIE